MLLIAIIVCFTMQSCSKDDEELDNVLTSEQKTALSSMYGTFTNTLPIVDWTTTIEFLEQYNPPKDATSKTGVIPQYIHGKLRITYYEGSSYVYYYRLNDNATRIYMGNKIDKWNNVKSQDFKYVSANEFKIKETNATLWDSYIRK